MKFATKIISILFSALPFVLVSQNVGIGTTSPSAKLDVKSSSSYLAQFNGASPMYMGILENDFFRGYLGSFSGNDEDVDFGTGSGNTNGKLHLAIQGSPALTINADSKVGIGTTNPQHKLHINDGDLFLNSSIGSIRIGYNSGNEWELGTTGGGADLRWYTSANGGTTSTARHYFSQNGNVGIGGFSGAGTPRGRLDIVGAGTTSSTSNTLMRNSAGDTLLRMRDDGRIGIGYNGSTYGRTMTIGGTGINFYTANETAFGGAIFPTDTSLVLWSNSGSNNYLLLQPSWGNTGVGTYSPNAKLHVNGGVLFGSSTTIPASGYTLSVKGNVMAEGYTTLPYASWPDYVFENEYYLMPLNELEKSIIQYKHLPNIPSAKEIETNGINLGQMTTKLLEKVEELTLYIIELNKNNQLLQQELNMIKDNK